MGSCNCGHLAQTVTRLDRAEIHRRAMERAGDWGEQAVEYCPTSGYAIDHVIEEMLALGLEQRDLIELERLSNAAVVRRLPLEHRDLRRNRREDVVQYLRAFAELVEDAIPVADSPTRPATPPAMTEARTPELVGAS